MNKLTIYLLFSIGFTLQAKTQILKDFEKGDISDWEQYPAAHWKLSSDQPISGLKSLRQWSDSAAASEDRISILLNGLMADEDTISYRFSLRHGSNPSSSNRWAVYLGYDEDASQMRPGGQGSGYVLGINMNSSDDCLRLFKLTDGSFHEILNTKFNWETSVGILQPAIIEVKRFPGGRWNISIDVKGHADSLSLIGAAVDAEISNFLYFGFYYNYTTTRNGMLWIDDLEITGQFRIDTIAPFIKSLTCINDSMLAASFSENMNFKNQDLKEGFSLTNCNLKPDTVYVISKDSLLLKFHTRFKELNWLQLSITDFIDLAGNKIASCKDSCFYTLVKMNDVCINEIMPDPSPVVRLPAYEYIELYNNRNYPINLERWTLSVGQDRKTLPSIILNGFAYLILCQVAAVSSFSLPGNNALGIFTSSSFLSNSGSYIQLNSPDDRLISQLSYGADWIKDAAKKEGGWSIEKIDPGLACSGKENWAVSIDKAGGTPGRINSVFRETGDHKPPEITGIFTDSDSSIILSFDESAGLNYPVEPSRFIIDHEIGSAKYCEAMDPDYSKLRFIFSNHFKQDTIYSIILDGSIMDCAGNHGKSEIWNFQLPSIPDSLDVVFNEIMYHPLPACPEFIEIYNRSKHAFNLADFRLATKDIYFGDSWSVSESISEDRLFQSGEYIVVTSNLEELQACYPQVKAKSIVNFGGMPSLTDAGQRVQLLSKELSVIDEMIYNDGMQFALLTNSTGVSLERVDFYRSSCDPTNWHSASSVCGFCTPGYENSQLSEAEKSDKVLSIRPEIFSPDNNGTDDILNIAYCIEQAGFIGSLYIFDSKGRQVKRLANNDLLGCRGQYSWDGISDCGTIQQPGIYIVFMQIYNLQGRTECYKKICVLSKTR